MSSLPASLGHYALSIVFSPITIPVYIGVSLFARKHVYASSSQIPANETGILLAISPLNDCPYFNNRMAAAAELYHAGKIKRIIASGGDYSDRTPPYNELTAMRDSLVRLGVSPGDIILDYDGRRTYLSVKNAKQKYGLQNVTFISQKYHIERALTIAVGMGLKAVGYSAAMAGSRGADLTCIARELPARIKMLADLLKGHKIFKK